MTGSTVPPVESGAIFDNSKAEVLEGKQPVLYRIGEGELANVQVGPRLITLLGGAPGAGKTAFVMQAVVEALRNQPELRACVCNVEMPPSALLDRQLARLTGVSLSAIRSRRFEDGLLEGRVLPEVATLEALKEWLTFVDPPFDLDNIAATFDNCKADLLVLDYIQRIDPGGKNGDSRSAVNATMNYLRSFAAAGAALLVVAAVARSKDDKGRSSYGGSNLSLASFRETSELEYGADDAFILAPTKDKKIVQLRHLKSRYGETRDIRLSFDREVQRLEPLLTAAQKRTS
jgi:replicative DNA helicase